MRYDPDKEISINALPDDFDHDDDDGMCTLQYSLIVG